ncbi:Hexose_transporter [Hexamita inflata]|uniref:Hexose transporter n=1 Tax=Hexamita inflata TaxID=28002 RepID=A0AA86QJE4_9EUKA|nr:Hexose transporter [Hexamita inflata]
MEINTKILSFASGVNWGIELTNLPVEIIEKYGQLTDTDTDNPGILSILEVAFCVGAAIGCITTPMYAGRLGFTNSLRMLFVLSILINGITMIPVHWLYLTVMRFLIGFTTSSISSLSPLLVAEVLNPHERGKTMMMFAVALNTGVLLAYVFHWCISFDYGVWMLSFAPPIICEIISMVCLFFIARAFKNQRKQSQRDEQVVQDDVPLMVEGDFGDVHTSSNFIKSSNEETSNTFQKKLEFSAPTDFNKKLTRTQFRRIVYVTVALGAMQMLTGVDAIIIYASEIFGELFESKKSGIYGSIILGIANLIYTFIAAPFAEHKPRRKMLFIGIAGVCVCHLTIAILYFVKAPTIVVLIFLMLLFLFYNLGPEPIVFMFFSEMFPERYKIKLNGLGYTVNWVANIISVFIFEFFVGGREQYVYIFFGVMTLILGISGTILAPETFGKTLAEIESQIRAWTKKERHTKKQIENNNKALRIDMEKVRMVSYQDGALE